MTAQSRFAEGLTVIGPSNKVFADALALKELPRPQATFDVAFIRAVGVDGERGAERLFQVDCEGKRSRSEGSK